MWNFAPRGLWRSRRPDAGTRHPPFDDAAADDHDAMINADGENVDLYIPRKCSWTNRLITATDKGSVQMNIGHLDANGVYSGSYTTVALSGYVRSKVRGRRSRTRESLSTRATRARDEVGVGREGWCERWALARDGSR